MNITITAISERQCVRFNIYKKQKNCETFSYTKSQKVFKNQNNIRYDLYIKIKTLYVTQFFIKF